VVIIWSTKVGPTKLPLPNGHLLLGGSLLLGSQTNLKGGLVGKLVGQNLIPIWGFHWEGTSLFPLPHYSGFGINSLGLGNLGLKPKTPIPIPTKEGFKGLKVVPGGGSNSFFKGRVSLRAFFPH